MSNPSNQNERISFLTLHPDDVLHLVEKSLKTEFTNLFRPLNSYINRVFELQARDGRGYVVKFYRPGRWTREAIQEEHDFLLELHDFEIPVIAPEKMADGKTLGSWCGIHYGLFPKCGGRSVDEFNDDQWQELGRLIGRAHAVGKTRKVEHRQTLHPSASTQEQIRYLKEKNLVPDSLGKDFFSLAEKLIEMIKDRFTGVELQRIHGDLHFSNIIYRPGESFYLIDFDDMVLGPQVQDIWMLLQKYSDESLVELDIFLEGYEMFNEFDRKTCSLIEPLRAMRYIHYLAWCGYQVVEDGRTMVVTDFGTEEFWQLEVKELQDQLERIEESKNPFDLI